MKNEGEIGNWEDLDIDSCNGEMEGEEEGRERKEDQYKKKKKKKKN